MSTVGYFELISGAPIICDKVTLYPPKLGDIRDVGYDNYREFISLFLMDKDSYAALFSIKNASMLDRWTTLQLITHSELRYCVL